MNERRVTRIQARNFLGLRAVDLALDDLTVVAGPSRAGKTSLIKALRAGLGGELPESAIREGEDRAEVIIDLSGAPPLRAERTWTAGGSRQRVIDASTGGVLPQPMAILRGLLRGLQFSPIQWLDLRPAEQRASILESVDVALPVGAVRDDLPPVPGEHPLDYLGRIAHGLEADRRDVGRDGKAAAVRLADAERALADMPVVEGAESVEVASARLREAEQQAAAQRGAADAWGRAQEKRAPKLAEVARLRVQATGEEPIDLDYMASRTTLALGTVEGLQAQLAAAEIILRDTRAEEQQARYDVAHRATRDSRIAELERDLADVAERPDTGATDAAIDAAQAAHQQAQQAAQRTQAAEVVRHALTEHEALQAQWQAMTADLDHYRSDLPAAILAGVDLGEVTVDGDGVRWHDRPLADCADSERLEVAVRIAARLTGELRLICVDGLERLDRARRAELVALISEAGCQAVCTRVADELEPGELVAQDGEIIAQEVAREG